MDIKKVIPHLIAVAIFLGLSAVYFYPQLQGKKLNQSDIVNSFLGASKEAMDYKESTGKIALWTSSMFSGMPTYQISLPGNLLLGWLDKVVKLFVKYPIGVFLGLMLGLYILFLILKVDYRIAIVASIAFGFSIYFLLLVDAGHNSKINSISHLALLFAGAYLVLEKRKWIFGGLLFSLGTALQLHANHVQMTYYFLFILGVYGIVQFLNYLNKKEIIVFTKGISILILAGVFALLTSLSKLWPTYEYMKDTMRGKPILETTTPDPSSSSSKDGLAWNYAMSYSQGMLDIISSIVPGAAGGSFSEPLSNKSTLRRNLAAKGYTQFSKFPLYWGTMESTGGPPYISIILWFFFIYSLFALKGPIRAWLGISLLLVLTMSLGKNLEFFNRFLFDYIPYFDKFRAPASIMTIASLLVAIGGGLGIQHLVKSVSTKKSKPNQKAVKYAGYTLGGLLILILVAGLTSFDFSGAVDVNFQQLQIENLIQDERRSLFYKSLIRTGFLAGIVFGISWLLSKRKIQSQYAIYGLGLLVIIDLWGVGRKYVSTDSFVTPTQYSKQIQPRQVDELIMKDNDPHFRVLDLSVDPFNSAIPSNFHKNIGGYHAAKLQRYQDIIERYISKNQSNVLNMLNAKYIITQQDNQPQLLPNAQSLGNAWFVDRYLVVETATEELNSLNGLEPAQMAIVHQEFSNYVQGLQLNKEGNINLTSYTPNELTYESNSNSEQLAVFSEVWYGPNKGWNAFIDGEKANHIRVNYVLRALRIPAGKHTILFKFEPQSVKLGRLISGISTLILLSGLILFIFRYYQKK